jgi:hypothetical protein
MRSETLAYSCDRIKDLIKRKCHALTPTNIPHVLLFTVIKSLWSPGVTLTRAAGGIDLADGNGGAEEKMGRARCCFSSFIRYDKAERRMGCGWLGDIHTADKRHLLASRLSRYKGNFIMMAGYNRKEPKIGSKP